MSKRALNQDALREISKTRGRFLSILTLVVIAVSFLFGLRMSAPDMMASMDAYLDEQNLMDAHIMATLGLTEEDVDALQAAGGTRQSEGAYSVDAIAYSADGADSLVVKAIGLSANGLNAPSLTEGRLPETAEECLVEPSMMETLGLSLGDTITLDTGSGAYEDSLAVDTFTIVGVGESPLYISMTRGTSTLGNGSVSAIVTLHPDAYALDYYTDIYLTVEGAAAVNAYDDAYTDLIDSYTDSLETLRQEREQARTDEVVGEAQAEIDDAWVEYYDGEAEAQQELDDAWQELQDAEQELTDGWADYYDGAADLDEARAQLIDGEAELADGRETLEESERDYQDGLAQYEDGYAQYEDGLAQYEEGAAALREQWDTFQQGQDAYDAGYAQYEAGESTYAERYAQYEAGESAYDEGLAQYEAGESAYAAGYAQYEAGEADYQENLAAFQPVWEAYQEDLAACQEKESALQSDQNDWEAAQDGYERDLQALNDRRAELEAEGWTEEEIAAELGEEERRLDALRTELEDQRTELETRASELAQEQAELSAREEALSPQKAALEEARATLDATQATLAATREQLDESAATLAATREQLDAAQTELEAGRAELDATRDLLEANEAELASGRSQLEAAQAELDGSKELLDATESQLADAQAELAAGRTELDDGWAEYYDGLDALEEARDELADGERELDDAFTELTDGQAEYEDGLAEYYDGEAEAQQELADARAEIEDAQREVDEIEPDEWYVLDRTSNTGFASYQQDAERMDRLATVFPTVFFLVAALVCLTTMTRMVEEQRVQIGGLKALGYSRMDIARKYVGYGLIASLTGSVIGLVLGGTFLPWVIVTCWKVMYDYPGVVLTVDWGMAAICVIAAVGCCTIAVLAAALAALRATPASLMRPKAPDPGKRVWLEHLPFLWKRMSFSHKVTARNLFRYQKRFWMTVIGIAGCTGLIITGFGLHDSIMDVLDLQFDRITLYSAIVYTDSGCSEDERAALETELAGESALDGYTSVYLTTVTLESPSYSLDSNLMSVEQPDDLDGFLDFHDRLTLEPVEMQTDGALISEKTAELLELGVGDTVTVVSGDERAEIEITGIVENYIQHYLYMTDQCYEAAFGHAPEEEQILLSYQPDADWEGIGSRLLQLDAVSGVYYMEETEEMVRSQLNGVYPAVVIIISAAGALAFVVLLNLSSINITERLRELATLKVLGFREKEMRDYVFRENLVLTFIGMALGVLVGKWFHSYLITTVEVDLVMFGRSAHLSSYLISVAMTLAFAFIVNLVGSRRLRKIDMVESLKTVE